MIYLYVKEEEEVNGRGRACGACMLACVHNMCCMIFVLISSFFHLVVIMGLRDISYLCVCVCVCVCVVIYQCNTATQYYVVCVCVCVFMS